MSKINPSLIIAAVVFMLIVGGFGWWINLNANPTAVIPMPLMPTPNAFDDFVAAGNAVVNSKLVDASVVDTPGPTMATLAMKQDAVAQNTVALTRLRIGLHETYWNPPARSYTALFPYYAHFRALARLLKVEGQVRSARGDWDGAVQSNLDSIQLGVSIPHGGVLIGTLVGIACEAIGRKDLWTNLQHLNATQARSAALRLEAINRNRFSYSATLQEEKWLTQASLIEIFRQGDVFQMFHSLVSSMGSGSISFDPEFLLYSKKTMFNNISNAMDANIKIGSLPYYQATRTMRPPIPRDPLSRVLLPVFDQARFKLVESEAQNALLEATLALHAYDLEHHAYPAKLSDLTPIYLARVPDDPFSASSPLNYHRSGASYVLYSVGPDGIDDGGKPIPESATGTNRFIEVTSLGDIVAGVTIH